MMHGGLLVLLHQVWDSLPVLLATRAGAASIELAGSIELTAAKIESTTEVDVVTKPLEAEKKEEKHEPTPPPVPEHFSSVTPEKVKVPPPSELLRREVTHTPSKTPPKKLPRATRTVEGLAEVDSKASPASQGNEGADVDNLPFTTPTNLPPRYPPEALAAGIEGVVTLRVTVNSSGTVDNVAVEKGSGDQTLDGAAVVAVQRWKFVPARRAGLVVSCDVLVPVRFSIRRI